MSRITDELKKLLEQLLAEEEGAAPQAAIEEVPQAPDVPQEEAAPQVEEEPTATIADSPVPAAESVPKTTEQIEAPVDPVASSEETIPVEQQAQELPTELAPPVDGEKMPKMEHGDPPDEELAELGEGEEASEDVPQNLSDDNGEEMPIDYKSVLEAQSAKSMALEAENVKLRTENERLKAKTEGAFGYSSKPTAPVKVNRLYDEGEVPRLRK